MGGPGFPPLDESVRYSELLHLSWGAGSPNCIVHLRIVEETRDCFLSRLEAIKDVLRPSESLIGC